MSTNLGTASPKVKVLAKLPKVGGFITKTNFEASAHQWGSISNSMFFKPQLVEQTIDPEGSFAALHPSRRISWVDNYLNTEDNKSAEGILWTQLDGSASELGIMSKVIADYDSYSVIPFEKQLDLDPAYIGPIWSDNYIEKPAPPDDRKLLEDFINAMAGAAPPEPPEPGLDEPSGEIESVCYVKQTRPKDRLWWGMESSSFLEEEDTPLWVTIRTHSPPTTYDSDTIFVIALGIGDKKHEYDIYLSLNNKPKLIDYIGQAGGNSPLVLKEFDSELSRIWSTDSYHSIGIMTIGGFLVIIVNGSVMVYQRVDSSEGDSGGKPLPCKIASGPIRIYGTNASCSFNVSPMTFAHQGFIALPIPELPDGKKWSGVDHRGDERGSVCELPAPPTIKEKIFGCDCEEFKSDSGSIGPFGEAFHKKGKIYLYPAPAANFAVLPSTKFYIMEFRSGNIPFAGLSNDIKYAGCPYFFRIKGVSVLDEPGVSGASGDITDSVISINETCNAPDYFHCKKSVDIVCYDENGRVSGIVSKGQSGIEVLWGWDGAANKTFTGVVTSINIGQKAGMETVTIRAEDYFYILKNTPIINSPFYDGMVAYYVIVDMAKRASLEGFINEWDDINDAFLPAGSSFTKPAMRYNGSQKLFECMMDIVKRYEAFLYFDANGSLVINRLPGGLFSEASPIAYFSSNPESTDELILGEKQVEMNYDSTVNVISALTLDRGSRNPIFHTTSAKGADNHLLFKKVFLMNQAALGSIEVCRDYVSRLKLRMFFPILKTRWKTAGTNVDIMPLSFVDVDGQDFRIMSIKRSFNAEANDLTTDYEGEWLGGA